MVLASMEPHFDEETDSLFLFRLNSQERSAFVEQLAWTPHGTTSYWLTSQVFGLHEARSREAELAIDAAKSFMAGRMNDLPVGLQSKEQIHEALKSSLPGQDTFWPRWMVKTGMEE